MTWRLVVYWLTELDKTSPPLTFLNMSDTVDKLSSLREHMQFEPECVGAQGDTSPEEWVVHLRDVKTGHEFDRMATVPGECGRHHLLPPKRSTCRSWKDKLTGPWKSFILPSGTWTMTKYRSKEQ